jgi:hypothetical protein
MLFKVLYGYSRMKSMLLQQFSSHKIQTFLHKEPCYGKFRENEVQGKW